VIAADRRVSCKNRKTEMALNACWTPVDGVENEAVGEALLQAAAHHSLPKERPRGASQTA